VAPHETRACAACWRQIIFAKAELLRHEGMTNPIRTAVVDDHPLFREGVAKLLARTPGIEIVADGSTGVAAVKIAEEFQPDILLLDLKLPDDGAAAASRIAREHPGVRIVILTASDADSDVAAMLQLGVHGYLLKGCTGQEIVRAVQRVYAGEFYVTPSLAARLLTEMSTPAAKAAESSEDLSSREEIILAQVSKGLTNKEIARALNLREKTVKHYMTNIMQKLGVRNRLEAVLMAQKRQYPAADAAPSIPSERSAPQVKSTTPQ
jgi:two-component system, NarL family, nitrate/nitrite response regulator NarL